MNKTPRPWPEHTIELPGFVVPCPECMSDDIRFLRRQKNMFDYRCLDCRRQFYLLVDGTKLYVCLVYRTEGYGE